MKMKTKSTYFNIFNVIKSVCHHFPPCQFPIKLQQFPAKSCCNVLPSWSLTSFNLILSNTPTTPNKNITNLPNSNSSFCQLQYLHITCQTQKKSWLNGRNIIICSFFCWSSPIYHNCQSINQIVTNLALTAKAECKSLLSTHVIKLCQECYWYLGTKRYYPTFLNLALSHYQIKMSYC